MFTKSVWYLPAALLLSLFLYLSVGLWFDEWITVGFEQRHGNVLYEVVSPATVDALREDRRLHNAILSLTEYLANTSENLGRQYGSQGLRDFGQNLTAELTRIHARPPPKKRGFLDDLGNLFKGGGGGGDGQPAQNDTGGILSGIGEALGIGGGNSSGGLGGLLSGGLASLGDSIIGGLATPALFLGIGVGYVQW
jgi:hypothetical protein